jgi:hypothetical protein
MAYEFSFLKALLLTVFIETTVLFLLFKLVYKSIFIKKWLLVLTGIIATFSTLPYLWFILPMFIHMELFYTIICEATAVMIESVIVLGMLRISYKNALIISFTCNTSSFLIGLLINWI